VSRRARLHEQEQLFRQLQRRSPDGEEEYLSRAMLAKDHGKLLRDLIAKRGRGATR
jgi:hypothetical protein